MHKVPKIKVGPKVIEVDFVETISGNVFPPNSPIQIYILSADNLWYLQKPVQVVEDGWTVSCHFGFQSSYERIYSIVALMTDERPKSPIGELPKNVFKSGVTKVKRLKQSVLV